MLVDRSEKVSGLRRAVTALGLTGKLIPQSPEDESATALLQRVGRGNVAADFQLGDLPTLPRSWRWVPLGSLITFGPKNGYSPKAVERETQVKSLTLTATTSGRFDGRYFKYIDEESEPDSHLWLEEGDVPCISAASTSVRWTQLVLGRASKLSGICWRLTAVSCVHSPVWTRSIWPTHPSRHASLHQTNAETTNEQSVIISIPTVNAAVISTFTSSPNRKTNATCAARILPNAAARISRSLGTW